jgi:hypothetical protein
LTDKKFKVFLVTRPDGSTYEYGLPTTPLNVVFTDEGVAEVEPSTPPGGPDA